MSYKQMVNEVGDKIGLVEVLLKNGEFIAVKNAKVKNSKEGLHVVSIEGCYFWEESIIMAVSFLENQNKEE